MMLRTRLTLGVSLCFIAVTAIVVLEGRLRLAEAERRFEQAEIAGHRNAWTGAFNAEMRGLKDEIAALPNNDLVVRALAEPASGALPAPGSSPSSVSSDPFFADLLARVRARLPGADLEVVRADGTVVSASHPGPARFLTGARLAGLLGATRGMQGLVAVPDPQAGHPPRVLIAVGAPVFTRFGAAGAVALLVDASALLPELEATTGTPVFLLAPDGRTVVAEGAPQWPGNPLVAQNAPANGRLVRVSVDGRVIESTLLPLQGMEGDRAAVFAVSRDITGPWRQALLLSTLSYGVVGTELALFLAALHWYLRISFRPLNAAIRVLNALSRGDTSVAGPSTTGRDEIGRLARTMENFRRDQKLLAETSAAKERIESELSVARDIQSHIVPTDFAFPDHPEFELHAVMEPAKAVGGDLYDFFMLDDRRLFFLIGDVSDKGVPAALFMAIAKALFKNVALATDLPLDQIMARVNRQLTTDNPSEMFVTVFACVLDLETGVVTYCDGGHELPGRLTPDGKAEILKKEGGLALGFIAEYAYQTARIDLQPGDAVLLYTDGVNEAMNPTHEMFKVERITTTLQGDLAARGSPADVTRTLLGAVHGFANGAAQSDDITILMVRWKGPRSAFVPAPGEVA
ncbi:PP2C family protein-serine/threonine phosphatase [Pararhodospirillum oryzae]|uniref:HAMP domain-containing protein n=1 Tax=Pararhodospirillum oryzae TaxID=478448 RepID=A0A512H760_9PROT|nr:SpoIIE family protein phosphatase [Pararhodospirillum oryzae]GEO81287.1 hypothetical protein ROR02_14180 [Pararhodospirillum oryzae]